MIISDINKTGEDHTDRAAAAKTGWVGYLLNQAALQIRTMTAVELQPLGLTPPQLRALEAISEGQPLSQTRLGNLVHLDRSTIVHVVDHFEALGVAARMPDLTDRRSHAVVLTAKGEAVLAEARDRARKVEDAFLAPLSAAQREALGQALMQLFEPAPCPEEKKREPSPSPPKP